MEAPRITSKRPLSPPLRGSAPDSWDLTEDRQLEAVDVHAFHLYLAWYPTTQPADPQASPSRRVNRGVPTAPNLKQ